MKTKIIHFSDTHESLPLESKRGYFDKRLLGMLNSRLLRKRLHQQEFFDRAVPMMLAENPDIIVYTGDATSFGQPSEFDHALKRLAPILETSVPFLYTPGNHDSYVHDKISQEALKQFYSALYRGKRQLSSKPFIMEINNIRFIPIHCAHPTLPLSSCGHMNRDTVQFLGQAVSGKGDSQIVVCGHFPVLEQRPVRRIRHRLYGASKIAKMLRDGEIDLSLCGHVHRPYEVLDYSGRGEICAGSLTRCGCFSVIEYDSDTNRYSLNRVYMKQPMK